MASLSKDDQARYIGWQGAFYNIAKIAATGGLVYLAGMLIETYTGDVTGLSPAAAAAAKHNGSVMAWTIIMAVIGGIMVILGLYNAKFVPSEVKKDAEERPGFKETMVELGNVFVDLFRKRPILYILHHSLSLCRGIRDEDCASLPQGRPCRSGSWTLGEGDRSVLRNFRSGCFRHR